MSESTECTELIPIMECSQQPIIRENLQDLRDMLATISTEVSSLPRTKESVPQVKKRRTQIRAYFESLDKQRKTVKAQVMAPYEAAMALYKEMVQGPISKLDAELKDFIDEVQAAAKQECEDNLRQYFSETCAARGIQWLKYEQMGIKVDMTLANQKTPKKAMDHIDAEIARVYNDLEVISTMEDYNDIMGFYIKTLDLAAAIDAVNQQKARKAEAERVQAEREAHRQQQEQHRQQIIEQAPEITQVEIQPQEPEEIYETGFAVRGTMAQLKALKAFLNGNHYDYNAMEV